jgi:hypothetical protein
MAEIVNLRRIRKRRARNEARREAAAQAALHGEGTAARRLRESRATLDARRLDGHRRSGNDDEA